MDKVKSMVTINLVMTALIGIALIIIAFMTLGGNGENKKEEEVDTSQVINFEDIKVIPIEDAMTNDIYSVEGDKKHTLRVKTTISLNSKHDDFKNISTVLADTEKIKLIISEINNIIREKNYEEITRPDSKEILEGEILKMLQQKFGSECIIRVDLWEFFHD